MTNVEFSPGTKHIDKEYNKYNTCAFNIGLIISSRWLYFASASGIDKILVLSMKY